MIDETGEGEGGTPKAQTECKNAAADGDHAEPSLPLTQPGVDPLIDDPKGGTNNDPRGDTNVDPRGETNNDFRGNTNIDPKGDTNIDPKGDTNIDPRGETNNDPKGDTNNDPKGDTNIDPRDDTNNDPRGHTNIETNIDNNDNNNNKGNSSTNANHEQQTIQQMKSIGLADGSINAATLGEIVQPKRDVLPGDFDPDVKESIKKDVLKSLDTLEVIKDHDFVPKLDDVWVEARCPARVDLYGGWTDTPPVCYEMGGSVVNMAVLVDGVHPISAKARLTALHSTIRLTLVEKNLSEKIVQVENIQQLLDFVNPMSQGALLKACVIACGIVKPGRDLSEQLESEFGGGLEIVSASHLPHGSGLGTSSILASAICAAVWTATGRLFDRKCLLHVVLAVEQLLTTGGGWQDQVGGIIGGIKRGFTKPGLPLRVRWEPLPIEDAFQELIEHHFVLIYTGKVRLARNILDVVLSRWHSNCPAMHDAFRRLHTGSMQMQGAIKTRDLGTMARLLGDYWQLKKKLAEGSEPPEVAQVIRAIEPLCLGYSLLGAGGGGFLVAITAAPDAHRLILHELTAKRQSQFDGVTVHRVTLDTRGILVYRGSASIRV